MATSSPSCLCTICHVHSDRNIAGRYEGRIPTCPQTDPWNSNSSIPYRTSLPSVLLRPNAPITSLNHYEPPLLGCTKSCVCILHHGGMSKGICPIPSVDPRCPQFFRMHGGERMRHCPCKTRTQQEDEGKYHQDEHRPHQRGCLSSQVHTSFQQRCLCKLNIVFVEMFIFIWFFNHYCKMTSADRGKLPTYGC